MIRKDIKSFKILNLKDNLIKDETADNIINCLKTNTNIIKLKLKLNPVKYAILKEVSTICKRNLENIKEKECPLIKNEINILKDRKDLAIKECGFEKNPICATEQISNKIKVF